MIQHLLHYFVDTSVSAMLLLPAVLSEATIHGFSLLFLSVVLLGTTTDHMENL